MPRTSAKRLWHTLVAQLGMRSRQAARTTAPPAESVDRVAQLSEPLLVVAAEEPLVSNAVEEVLLSSDLLPHILAQLRAEDSAAAAVCWQWNDGWEEKLDAKLPLTLKFWSPHCGKNAM